MVLWYNLSTSSGGTRSLLLRGGKKVTEEIKNIIGESLSKLNVWIDSVYVEEEGTNTFLRIILDADFIIPLNTVVMATRIMNPLIDKADLMSDAYILDIYAKEKGDVNNE